MLKDRLLDELDNFWRNFLVRPTKRPETRNDDELQDAIEVINNSNWKAVGESAPWRAVVSPDVARTLHSLTGVDISTYEEMRRVQHDNQVESQRRVNQSIEEIFTRMYQQDLQRQREREQSPPPPQETISNTEEVKGVEDRLVKMTRKIQVD